MGKEQEGGFREKLKPFYPLAIIGGIIAIIAKIAAAL